MRRLVAPVAVAALVLATAPAAHAQAAATCLPKGAQTANAQLQYDLSVEAALVQRHTRDVLADPSRAVTYVGQTMTSGAMLVAALDRYARRMGRALVTEPPSC